ncbi:MAG: histidinol phosphate phosphatase domain-containing protein [Syntrophaceae bacterium]|nr:histidinol phosphate phosphatase domain-containing protein [Syntrophaceae bacterium]
MIDLHTHTIFSDGELIPSELVRRAMDKGYRAIALTDHTDLSNIDFIVPRMVKVCNQLREALGIAVLPGVELTHVPPQHIGELAEEGRKLGAAIVIVHGETLVEPVMTGTNLAAVQADIDILAHPGLVTDEVAELAARRGIYFEVSARKGHSLANGHVVSCARKHGVRLLLNTDAHAPGDLITQDFACRVACGAGLDESDVYGIFDNAAKLVARKIS